MPKFAVRLLLFVILLLRLLPVSAQELPLPVNQLQAPVNVVPAESIATYQPGALLEGITIDDAGNLYFTSIVLTSATGGDSALLKLTPNGDLSLLTDEIVFGGVLTYVDGLLYMTSNAPQEPEAHGVWTITLDGDAQPWVLLPEGSSPNGITLLPDGDFLVADAYAGKLYRIDTETETVSVWLDNPELLAPVTPGLPGANGVQVYENAVYVTVSDYQTVVRIPILEDGSAGETVIHAEGIAGDDFSIDTEGNLYVTTHPFNTVTKVFSDGSMETIATADQNIIGSTATVFGNQPGDETSLYVVNDGGVFEVMMGIRETPLEPHIVRLEVGVKGYQIP